MLYYIVEALTKESEPRRIRSFHCLDTAQKYSDLLIKENPNHWWIGVVDYEEWYHCFA